MECQAESILDPNIRYTWTKNGRPFIINGQDVFSESSLNGNILFISPKSSDVGTYQCEAMNDFGNAFSEASLLRAQTFKQPRRLNIVDPVPAQVLIDPNVELKDMIERIPITQAVPESLPTFAQNSIFYVFPARYKVHFI